MMRFSIPRGLILHALLAGCFVAAQPRSGPMDIRLDIGGTPMRIPLIPEFNDARISLGNESAALLRSTDQNNNLAALVWDRDLQRAGSHPPERLMRWMNVMVPKSVEFRTVTAANYQSVLDAVAKQPSIDLESANERMKQQYGEKIQVNSAEWLGPAFRDPGAAGFLLLMRMTGADGQPRVVLCGMALLFLKGKMFNLYVYRQFDDESKAWVTRTAQQWAAATIEANR